MPHRIPRHRRKGWTKKDAVIVTRPANPKARLPMGRWGNPFDLGRFDRQTALWLLAVYARQRLVVEPDWLAPLRGKDVACWCAESQACHADLLLQLANR
jgi:hypothetical protein